MTVLPKREEEVGMVDRSDKPEMLSLGGEEGRGVVVRMKAMGGRWATTTPVVLVVEEEGLVNITFRPVKSSPEMVEDQTRRRTKQTTS